MAKPLTFVYLLIIKLLNKSCLSAPIIAPFSFLKTKFKKVMRKELNRKR